MKIFAKGLLLDYGGTIDTNGVHWGEVIWQAYVDFNIPVSKEDYRKAYVHVERLLGSRPVIRPENTFRETLQIKMLYQFEFLGLKDTSVAGLIADACYTKTQKTIDNASNVLKELKEHYPMILVSNFYGNLRTVLSEFGLTTYFSQIIESAEIGIRKPDPAIYQLGIDALRLPPEEIIVIGDSYKNDIQPATHLGCRTIWLKGKGWNEKEEKEYSTESSMIIKDFCDLRSLSTP